MSWSQTTQSWCHGRLGDRGGFDITNPHDHFVFPDMLSVNPMPSKAAIRFLLAMRGANAGEIVGKRLPVFLCVSFSSGVMASACAFWGITEKKKLICKGSTIVTSSSAYTKHAVDNKWRLNAILFTPNIPPLRLVFWLVRFLHRKGYRVRHRSHRDGIACAMIPPQHGNRRPMHA